MTIVSTHLDVWAEMRQVILKVPCAFLGSMMYDCRIARMGSRDFI